MLSALLRTLSRDRRTSLGEPVEPDVLSSRARSGWRSWALCSRRSVAAQPSGPACSTTSGSYAATSCVALGVAAVRDEQRDVAVLQRGEVGDHGVEPVGALDEHQSTGVAEASRGSVPDALRELGVGDRTLLGPERDVATSPREVEDRARQCALGCVEKQGHARSLT